MNRKLTKAEIIENINDKIGMDLEDIHAIIDEFLDQVKDRQLNSGALERSKSKYARVRRKQEIQRQAK